MFARHGGSVCDSENVRHGVRASVGLVAVVCADDVRVRVVVGLVRVTVVCQCEDVRVSVRVGFVPVVCEDVRVRVVFGLVRVTVVCEDLRVCWVSACCEDVRVCACSSRVGSCYCRV